MEPRKDTGAAVTSAGSAKAAAPVKPAKIAEETAKLSTGTSAKETTEPSTDPSAKKAGTSGKSEPTVEAVRPSMVKVIPGTRRYHSSACPLIKGSDSGSLETMSRADAEAGGLTLCSVCASR